VVTPRGDPSVFYRGFWICPRQHGNRRAVLGGDPHHGGERHDLPAHLALLLIKRGFQNGQDGLVRVGSLPEFQVILGSDFDLTADRTLRAYKTAC
jgi:hypothetical protein